MQFPSTFMLGAATAAHQVEGNNKNSDCWAMEQMPHSMYNEPSLDAVDHYNRFREDIDLMADAGLNTYRFSIEWARIQPSPDSFDADQIAHYRQVLTYCHAKNITPIVTMHHFSSPKWLIEEGGWENEQTIARFVAYCTYVANELGDLMEYVCTINEANMGLQLVKIIQAMTQESAPEVQVGVKAGNNDSMHEYMSSLSTLFGGLPAHEIACFLSPRTDFGDTLIMRAHEAARDAMKQLCPHLKIGLTLSIYDYQAQVGGEELAYKEYENDFLHYLPYLQQDDFFGLQNYTRKLIGPNGTIAPPKDSPLSEMGYEIYPDAVANVIRFVHQHLKKPIIVTENGVATQDDSCRIAFIDQALQGVQHCIQDGIPVAGYIYWSLLDNYEWQLGFNRHFGLIEVNRQTQQRTPKESLRHLGSYLSNVL
ncbi:MAG: glycoside hydrolase family 1 protein [Clostridiales bacterium]|nr:glycoside hydrolase family 1 protein [Clostridiales bacterium]